MTPLFIVAAIIIPFAAEAFAVRMPNDVRRSLAFYALSPIMGALVYAGFLFVTAHPYLALGGTALYYFGLTAVSNKKFEVLRDPFNAHDFDNARNLYIYPEFYVSYVGWPILALVITALISVIAASIWFETAIPVYALGPWYMVWPITLIWWFGSLWIIARIITLYFNENTMAKIGVTLDLKTDVARFGLFPTVFLYRLLLKARADKKALRQRVHHATTQNSRPADIIAIQGESYFDLERLFSKIDGAAPWEPLRELERSGVSTGQIDVPAWGAYTMQTEFAFLSGLPNHLLGIDRINPYMRFAQKPVNTFVTALKEAGYRTICVHPAKKEFFRRSDVMPNLGFDEFIGLEAFEGAEYFGKYISDKALADQMDALIKDHHAVSEQPLFVFAITIESHGPWADGRLAAHLPEGCTEESLLAANNTTDSEFTLYQQHMENLLALYKRLSMDAGPEGSARVVAMYGDHMPALGTLFDQHGFSDKPVDYLVWNSSKKPVLSGNQRIETFAASVLAEAGVTLKTP